MPVAKQSNIQTFSGNRIFVEFGGQRIGLIQSVRASDNYAHEDASGIGSIQIQEFVPSKAVHQLSVSGMVLFVGNMRDQGLSLENGADAMRGLIFDVAIFGSTVEGPADTGGLLRTYIGCVFDSGDIDVTAHRITIQSGQLKALDVIGTGI